MSEIVSTGGHVPSEVDRLQARLDAAAAERDAERERAELERANYLRAEEALQDVGSQLTEAEERAERLEQELEAVKRMYPNVKDFLDARALSAASTPKGTDE